MDYNNTIISFHIFFTDLSQDNQVGKGNAKYIIQRIQVVSQSFLGETFYGNAGT